MKKIIGNIVFIFICGLLIIAILSQFGILPFRITYFLTGSMMPTYAPGDLAVFYSGSINNLGVGDVVLFQQGEVPIIHRIVSVDGDQIRTQGDANNVADQGTITHVDGRLLFSIPKLGYLFDYFHTIILSVGKMITAR